MTMTLMMLVMTVMMLFIVGESSGKASRSVATYTPGPAGMTYAQEASTAAVSEIGRAKMVRLELWVLPFFK